MGFHRSHRGSVLGMLLALLAVVSLLVFAAQWSARFAAVAVRRETLAVDSFHRAWGLVQLMTSRVKKRIELDVDPLRALPSEDTESGTWEGREFILGWNRGPAGHRPVEVPMSVWIRFPKDVPSITHRFDLTVRIPALLDAFAIEVVGYRIDNLDPLSTLARTRSFRNRGADPARNPSTGSLVEILDARITSDLRQTRAPGASWADQEASTILGLIAPVRECLEDRMQSLTRTTSTATVEAARRALTRAQQMAEPLLSWLEPGCRHRLADELDRLASARTGVERQTLLGEARAVVEPVALADPESCGAPVAGWLLARILMRSRPDPALRDSLVQERNRCLVNLRWICSRNPDAPIRRRSDIRRRELPDHFEKIWRSRGALPHSPGEKTAVSVTTFLPDGGSPVELTATAAPGSEIRWSSDSASVLVERRNSTSGAEIWSLMSDGSSIERIPLEDLSDCAGRTRNLVRTGPARLFTPAFQTASGVRSYAVGAARGGIDSRLAILDLCHMSELAGAGGARTAFHTTGDRIHLLAFPGALREGGERVPDGLVVHERFDPREGPSGVPAMISIGELARFAGAPTGGAFFTENEGARLALMTTQAGGRPAIATFDLESDSLLDIAYFPGGVVEDREATLRWLPGTAELLALVGGRLFRATVRAGVMGRIAELSGVPSATRWASLASGPGTVIVLGGGREDGPLAGLDIATGTTWPLSGPGTPFAGGRLTSQTVAFSPTPEEARP